MVLVVAVLGAGGKQGEGRICVKHASLSRCVGPWPRYLGYYEMANALKPVGWFPDQPFNGENQWKDLTMKQVQHQGSAA